MNRSPNSEGFNDLTELSLFWLQYTKDNTVSLTAWKSYLYNINKKDLVILSDPEPEEYRIRLGAWNLTANDHVQELRVDRIIDVSHPSK